MNSVKLMIVSDIHGSAYYCEKMLEAFASEKPDKLVVLGDILYHGPRNDLPKNYEPKKVIEMLNDLRVKEKILCVRGNCDTEVDQMVLDFPILADYAVIFAGERVIYATHGHIYNSENLPPLNKGDVLLSGHTHIPCNYEKDGIIFVNPGSVSIPKENSANGYVIFEDNKFTHKDLDGNIICL